MRRRLWTKILERLVDVSAGMLLVWWAGLVLICTFAYMGLARILPEHAPLFAGGAPLYHFLDSLYFSIVTVTTVGYGDILPQGFSRAIAATEGTLGFALFGLLVGKLASMRQEKVTREVHRHAVNDTFASLREGLFMLRKDLDAGILHAKRRPLSDDFWEKLSVSHLHAQMLIREIPSFYESGFGSLDEAREHLLIESVRRTVRRLGTFLDAHGAVPSTQGAEIAAFLHSVENVMAVWAKHAPSHATDIRNVAREAREMRKLMADTVPVNAPRRRR